MSDPVNTPVYMTAKLNLANGTIIYPQISLDNIVRAIDDPTLVTVAETVGGKVPVTELPVVNAVASTGSTANIPTEYAVRALANTKQDTLTGGAGVTIADGTISFNGTTLDVTTIDSTKTNGVFLSLDGSMLSAKAELAGATAGVAGTILGGSNNVEVEDGVIQGATPEDICGGTGSIITSKNFNTALNKGWNFEDPTDPAVIKYGYYGGNYSVDTVNKEITVTGIIQTGLTASGIQIGPGFHWLSSRHAKWLVIAEIYCTERSVGIGGNVIVRATGIPTSSGSVYNQWTRIGGLVDTTTNLRPEGYLRIYMSSSVGSSITFKVRRIAFIDATDIPESEWASIALSDPGYIFEAGDGIRIDQDLFSVDEATAAEMIDGATVGNKTVTPRAFAGGLSTGKAVDVTNIPFADTGTLVNIVDGTPTASLTDAKGTIQWSTTTAGTVKIGFYDTTTHAFPAWADDGQGNGLWYLMLADVKNTGTDRLSITALTTSVLGVAVLDPSQTMRIASLFNTKNGGYLTFSATTGSKLEITNMREYEVNGCTDEARQYIARLTNPDDLNAYYLVDTEEVNPWVPYINMKDSSYTVIASGLNYKLMANDSNTHVLSTDTCPRGYYGRDSHLELFVGQTGLIQVNAPLMLMQAFTPNAVNNCTIKFRDGEARLYVDDTAYGYTVNVTAGTESGSLYYGLWDSDAEYIVFSETLDGQTVSVEGSAGLAKNCYITGNGTDKTDINLNGGFGSSNAIFSMTNLSISGEIVERLRYSPGARAAYDNVYFHDIVSTGRVIDSSWNGSDITGIWINNCTFENIKAPSGVTYLRYCALVTGCTFSNISGYAVTGYYKGTYNKVDVRNTVFDVSAQGTGYTDGGAVYCGGPWTDNAQQTAITDCVFLTGQDTIKMDRTYCTLTVNGTNVFNGTITGNSGIVYLSPNATLDLSGNTNTVVMPSGSSNKIMIVGSTDSQGTLTYGTANIIPAGKTEPIEVVGSGKVLLKNGRLGLPVTALSGSTAGTLQNCVVSGTTVCTNIIFDPTTTDDQVVTAPGNYISISNDYVADGDMRCILGNGADKTTICAIRVNNISFGILRVEDLTMQMEGTPFFHSSASGTKHGGFIMKNVLFTGAWGVGADGNMFDSYETFTLRNVTFNNITVGSGITATLFKNVRSRPVDPSVDMLLENCTFGPTLSEGIVALDTGTNTSYSNVVTAIRGCTFSCPTAGIVVGQVLNIYGNNVFNNTVAGVAGGTGSVMFADGATVTSTIPSGQTVGTGTFSGLIIKQDDTSVSSGEFNGVTITGFTSTVNNDNRILFRNRDFKNCVISGETTEFSSGFFVYYNGGTHSIIDTTVSLGTGLRFLDLTGNAVLNISGSSIANSNYMYQTSIVNLSGTTKVGLTGSDTGGVATSCSVRIKANSTVEGKIDMTGATGDSTISVGNYNGSGAWVVGGTASVVSGATTYHIWGSGTIINGTTTDLQNDL